MNFWPGPNTGGLPSSGSRWAPTEGDRRRSLADRAGELKEEFSQEFVLDAVGAFPDQGELTLQGRRRIPRGVANSGAGDGRLNGQDLPGPA